MTGDNGMKIEFSEKVAPKELSFDEAKGVLADNDGEVWIVEEDVILYVSEEFALYNLGEWYNAFKKHGPFTKYNGVVTISN
jgi:hypothetical protein